MEDRASMPDASFPRFARLRASYSQLGEHQLSALSTESHQTESWL
jgi:hypothetical protein